MRPEAADHATDSAGLKEGVAMVAKQLDDTLTKHSVEEISTEDGAFDPNLHEAISQMPSEDHELDRSCMLLKRDFACMIA